MFGGVDAAWPKDEGVVVLVEAVQAGYCCIDFGQLGRLKISCTK